MPKSHSTKRALDREIFAAWAKAPDATFGQLGIAREELEEYQIALRGHIVLPVSPSYDTDRQLTNPVFDGAPCLIVFCAIENDVRIALEIAGRTDMPFAVRSGGHCTAGYSSGPGVLIDVRALNQCIPDTQAMVLHVGTGCDFDKLNKTLLPLGLHVPGGECGGVCIGGFVQGGGLGFTSASFGMNCDNVLSMQVMLGDGSVVTATAGQNADLWWAMRGGTGGNFGILLSVTYRLHSLPSCSGWGLAWPMTTDADRQVCAKVMRVLQDDYILAGAPGAPRTHGAYGDKLTLQALFVYQNLLKKGGEWHDPKIPVFMVRGLWVGDPDEGFDAMKRLAAIGAPTLQVKITDTYPVVLDALLNQPQEQPVVDPAMGMPNEDKSSRYVADPIAPADWTEIFDLFVTQSPNDLTYGYLEVYGGAIAAFPLEDSAFVHRDVLYNVVMDVFWYKPADRAKAAAFMSQWNTMIERHWNGGVYQNYCSINVPDYMGNYWKDAVSGLYLVKQKYDPESRFRFAQQIRNPGIGAGGTGDLPIPERVRTALAQPIDRAHAQTLRSPVAAE